MGKGNNEKKAAAINAAKKEAAKKVAKKAKQKKIIMLIALLAVTAAIVLAVVIGTSGSSGASADGIDLDISRMSGTMAYSTISNMQRNPASRLGQTIRAAGMYVAQDDRHFVVIDGPPGCCPANFELRWSGEGTFPTLASGASILVDGVFSRDGNVLYLAIDDI